jgi:protein associated with RNAse G/E
LLEKSNTIKSRKFDGSVRRSWKCDLTDRDGSLLVFLGIFDLEVNHSDLGIIRRGTVSYEYYWLDRWYNVFRFHEPDGSLRNFYCNINMPPVFEDGVLDYVDLDIDVLVWPSSEYKILDLEEFEDNSEKFQYPDHLKDSAQSALKELLQLIETKQFPFGSSEFT